MSKLFSSFKKRGDSIITLSNSSHDNNNDNCFQQIEQLDQIEIMCPSDSQILITLTAPDTWSDSVDKGVWFAIEANGKIISRGIYRAGSKGQRVPISIQTVVDVKTSESYIIKGMWCNGANGGNCYLGAWSEVSLTALLVF